MLFVGSISTYLSVLLLGSLMLRGRAEKRGCGNFEEEVPSVGIIVRLSSFTILAPRFITSTSDLSRLHRGWMPAS